MSFVKEKNIMRFQLIYQNTDIKVANSQSKTALHDNFG